LTALAAPKLSFFEAPWRRTALADLEFNAICPRKPVEHTIYFRSGECFIASMAIACFDDERDAVFAILRIKDPRDDMPNLTVLGFVTVQPLENTGRQNHVADGWQMARKRLEAKFLLPIHDPAIRFPIQNSNMTHRAILSSASLCQPNGDGASVNADRLLGACARGEPGLSSAADYVK
jgi:hypothetical protein